MASSVCSSLVMVKFVLWFMRYSVGAVFLFPTSFLSLQIKVSSRQNNPSISILNNFLEMLRMSPSSGEELGEQDRPVEVV